MGFFVNAQYIHKHNVILNETVTKLFTILTKWFFSFLNPTSYLKESWQLCLNLCSRKLLKIQAQQSKQFNTFRIYQSYTLFEDGLKNFRITFLKAQFKKALQ